MNEIATTTQQNPFANAQVMARPSTGNAVAMTDQSRAVAEVQAAMMIARMNPRDQIAAMDRILNACSRSTLADVAVYQYSRGGTDITGPSIRLAESIAQNWGNLQFGIRELDQRNGESTVQAYAWDVETNTRREVTFQIPHTRYTRKGSYKLEDPRDIYEMVANQGSRRLRACILAVVPGDVVEAAVNQCELTMKAKADTSPDALKKMVDAFAAFGVSKEQIEKRIQRRLDAIQPAQMVGLKKIYTSLRDGMSTPADWFEHEEEKNIDTGGNTANKSATDSLKQKLQTKPPATTVQPEPPQGGAPEQTDQPPQGDQQPAAQDAPPTEPETTEQSAGAVSPLVLKFMKEINQATTDGSVAVDQWRMKHVNRVLRECGGDKNDKNFIEIMNYAQIAYDECLRGEKEAPAQNQTTGGPQNGKLF